MTRRVITGEASRSDAYFHGRSKNRTEPATDPAPLTEGEVIDDPGRMQRFLDRNFGGSMARYRQWRNHKLNPEDNPGDNTREGCYGDYDGPDGEGR